MSVTPSAKGEIKLVWLNVYDLDKKPKEKDGKYPLLTLGNYTACREDINALEAIIEARNKRADKDMANENRVLSFKDKLTEDLMEETRFAILFSLEVEGAEKKEQGWVKCEHKECEILGGAGRATYKGLFIIALRWHFADIT